MLWLNLDPAGENENMQQYVMRTDSLTIELRFMLRVPEGAEILCFRFINI